MPGIFGIISDNNHEILLHQMRDSLNHNPYIYNEYIQNGVNISKLSLKNSGYFAGPLFDQKEDLVLLFDGEIFSFSEGYSVPISDKQDYASLFLQFITKYGLEHLQEINGHFSAFVYYFNTKKACLITDRNATHPLYYSKNNNRFVFAPEVKAVLKDSIKKTIDLRSISELFSFGHLFGYKTMFEEISMMPPASVLTYSGNSIQIKKYYDFNYREETFIYSPLDKKHFKNLQNELEYHLLNAIKNLSVNSEKILLSLSGGLDSRYVAALYNKTGVHNMTAFTMGPAESGDRIYAGQVAKKLNMNHYAFEIKPGNIWDDARFFSHLSDHMTFIYGSIQNLEPLRHFSNNFNTVVYSQMCDALFGNTLKRKAVKKIIEINKNTPETDELLINMFRLFDQELIEMIFKKDFYNRIKGLYRIEPQKYLDYRYHPLYNYYRILMNEHGRRATLGGNLVTDLLYETRMLSYDNNIFDFGWNLPIIYREHQYLYRMTFDRMFPGLAKIKREGYNLRIGASKFRYDLKVLENKLAIVSKNSPLNVITKYYKPWNRPIYVNYKGWFRNELRNNIYHMFFEEEICSREILNVDGVKQIVTDHINGKKDYARLIWQIINLEYFYRNLISE